LGRLRRRVRTDLRGRGLDRNRVLAAAVRLIDKGLFRAGGDEYPTYGIATLEVQHVDLRPPRMTFSYDGKSGVEQRVTISDVLVAPVVRQLCADRKPSDRLLAYRDGDEWREIHAADINEYLRAASAADMTAKDLRTWHATVIAAIELADAGPAASQRAQQRTIRQVMRTVADELGNTPAVARASYVDPLVIEMYRHGETAEVPPSARRGGLGAETAVLRLLSAD
ncbi:MAG TPA: DNA topoisomerase IB, partial [Micromonosporaceae bacterium]